MIDLDYSTSVPTQILLPTVKSLPQCEYSDRVFSPIHSHYLHGISVTPLYYNLE